MASQPLRIMSNFVTEENHIGRRKGLVVKS